MAPILTEQGLQEQPQTNPFAEQVETKRQECIQRGGKWVNGQCVMPVEAKVPAGTVETFSSEEGRASGVVTPSGKTFLGLSPEDVQTVAEGEAARVARPEGSAPVGTAQRRAEALQQSTLLAQQAGQFTPLGVEGTEGVLGGIDPAEAAIEGVRQSIPRALSLAVTGAGVGATAGLAGGPAAPVTVSGGALIGAAAGFTSGIASGMLSSSKRQRTDTTNAQQRVLDEGKQTLKDWVTMAKADPANKAQYLQEFNIQLSQINQAHQQMKLDTSQDVLRFESAIPNLAEFDSFYSTGGERDALVQEMQIALVTPSTAEYDLLELSNRRGA